MAYIGKQPLIGNFQVCDAISTVNGQAAYTLQVGGVNVSPETVNNMIVSVNGVIQKPTASYTVSGSTITFTSALVTGDVIDFIQILGNVLDLGVPSDNTVSLAKLTATGTKDATTFLRGDNTFAVAGGTNTPAFFANANGQTITISNASTTKVSYNTEVVDTDNNYSSGRFTPTTAGKYFCFASLAYDSDQDFDDIRIEIRKNSTTIAEQLTRNMYYSGLYTSAIADLNGSSDYIEIYTTQWSGANADLLTNVDGARCVFGAYKLLT